jgi:hypothetical protein
MACLLTGVYAQQCGYDHYYGLRDDVCNHFNPGIRRPGEGLPVQKSSPSFRTWCIDDSLVSP